MPCEAYAHARRLRRSQPGSPGTSCSPWSPTARPRYLGRGRRSLPHDEIRSADYDGARQGGLGQDSGRREGLDALVDEEAADGAARGPAPDPRYYGPFGPQPDATSAPPGAELTRPAPVRAAPDRLARRRTSAAAGGHSGTRFGRSPAAPPRDLRAGNAGVIAIAAAVALLIGGGAGYGGARLGSAGRTRAGHVQHRDTGRTDLRPDHGSHPDLSGHSRSRCRRRPPRSTPSHVAKRTLPGTVMIQAGRRHRFRVRARHPGPDHDQQSCRGRRRGRELDDHGCIFADGRRQKATPGRSQPVLRPGGDQGRRRRSR